MLDALGQAMSAIGPSGSMIAGAGATGAAVFWLAKLLRGMRMDAQAEGNLNVYSAEMREMIAALKAERDSWRQQVEEGRLTLTGLMQLSARREADIAAMDERHKTMLRELDGLRKYSLRLQRHVERLGTALVEVSQKPEHLALIQHYDGKPYYPDSLRREPAAPAPDGGPGPCADE